MKEVLPGVLHWTATHPNTGSEVSSYWVNLLFAHGDPIIGGGKDALRGFAET